MIVVCVAQVFLGGTPSGVILSPQRGHAGLDAFIHPVVHGGDTQGLEPVRGIAARALGVSDSVIMVKHLLPNAMVATLTFMPFVLNSSITTLTSLDFLGFGLPPGSPSLGELLAQGKANLQAPWLGFSGFFTIAVMLSLLIFVGEAVRDAFDPRKTLT